jgi:hypothetical protein
MHNKPFTEIFKTFSTTSSAVVLTLCSTLALAQTLFANDANQGEENRAHVLLVDDDRQECPDAGFTTIQAAVNAAAPGDTIQVCPGAYNEQVEIAKRLTLVGTERNGKNAAIVRPSNIVINTDFLGEPTASIILVRDTSKVTIRNITIDGINNGLVCDATAPSMDGIFFRNASGEIESVAIKNMLSPDACAFADGVDVLSTGEPHQRVTVRDSSLHDYDFGGIFCLGQGVTVSAIRNVITGRGPSLGQFGIQLDDGPTGLIEENIVTNHLTADFSVSGFVSHGIGVFGAPGNTRIAKNIVGNSDTGMYVGILDLQSNNVTVVDNTVFNSLVRGIHSVGNDNHFENNAITSSGLTDIGLGHRAGVFLQGSNNRIQDNTINEAFIGLLVSTGNHLSGDHFFNTLVNQSVFVPQLSAETGLPSLPQNVIARSVLSKRLSR